MFFTSKNELLFLFFLIKMRIKYLQYLLNRISVGSSVFAAHGRHQQTDTQTRREKQAEHSTPSCSVPD